MKPFTFAPHAFAPEYKEKGYLHIREGVDGGFLSFAKQQLAQCRLTGKNELAAREIKNKKKQYLFELPDEDFLHELTSAIGALTGLDDGAEITLSERHIMIYDDNASSLPPLHKDRVASEVAVGIPLETSTDARIALLPYSARGVNLLDNAIYCPRAMGSLARTAKGWCLEDSEYPKAPNGISDLVELDARPGDMVVFAGSSIYHGRLNASKSAALYFKFNTKSLDPLGEDPSTPARRENGVKALQRKGDDELLRSLVQLSPRLQHVSRRYTRPDWMPVLQASVSGEKDFALSDDDSRFLFALQGRRTVRDILMALDFSENQLLSHVPRIRRLCRLGAIDFLD